MNIQMKKGLKEAKAKLTGIKMPTMPKVKMPKMKMPKISKKQAMIAGAVAGATLLCSIAGYSIYAIKNSQKKVDFKKVKIQVVKGLKKAHQKMSK